MILGFTGTQRGMRPRQAKAVRHLLYSCKVLHLGDCVGADAEAHGIAGETGVYRVSHPPTGSSFRAFLEYEESREPEPYLKRNVSIVLEGVDGLIAASGDWIEVLRSGTWTTVRRARELGRRIWIVRPDGSVREEAAIDNQLPEGILL